MAAPRRDIKELTATIADLGVGDLVEGSFATPRYGHFTIEGTVLQGMDRKTLSVGSWHLNSDDKPAKALTALRILAKAGEHDKAIYPGSEASEHFGN
jgi:hypothetical protein